MDLLNFEALRILVAVGGTALAAYQDFRTSFIDDKILYAMMGVGALLTLASGDSTLITYTLGVALAIFLFGYLLYRQGQLGMGDVLLFVGLQVLLPFHPGLLSAGVGNPFPFDTLASLAPPDSTAFVTLNVLRHTLFFLTIFLVSSYAATLATSFQYARELLKRKKLKPSPIGAAISVVLAAFAFYFVFPRLGLSWASALLFLLLAATSFFFIFRQQLLSEVVMRPVKLKDIEDEDILALDELPKALVRKYHLQKVLTLSERKKLAVVARKEGLSSFPVYKVLPRFGPYVLIGLLVALFFGDLFSLMLTLAGIR